MELDFSHPGKPLDDTLIEALNGRSRARAGCLDASWSLSLEDARAKIAA